MNVWEFGYKIIPQYPGDTGFRRNLYGDITEVRDWVKKFGPEDIYTSVYKYQSPDVVTSTLEAGLYFDLDKEDDLEAAYEDLLALVVILGSQGISRESIHVWFSGFKGFHVTIPFGAMGISPARDLADVYKKIAGELNNYLPNKTLDTTVYESKRLWRFPNTINSKSGLHKIQLPIDIPSLDEVKQLAKTPQPIKLVNPLPIKTLSLWVDRARRELVEESRPKPTTHQSYSEEVSPENQNLLNSGVSANRNNTTFYLACYLKSKGWDISRTTNELLQFGERCTPPASANHSDYNQAAIEKTIKSAYQERSRA